MQASNNVLGSPDSVSLVDEMHILALIYVFGISFTAINAVMICLAYTAGWSRSQ